MGMTQELMDFAITKHNIKFEYMSDEQLDKHGTSHGAWGYTREGDRYVLIQDDIKNETRLMVTIAHEIGHILNLIHDFNNDTELFFKSNIPSVVMFREYAAWQYAVKVLQLVEFQDWDFFIKDVSHALGTYYCNTWSPYMRHSKRKPLNYIKPKMVFIHELKTMIKGEGNDEK